jgi:iron complex transport system ATP-binding protein
MDIKDINFSYNNRIKTLHSISSTIEIGKVTTIIGPNGSGKSTLLGILSNNIVPQSGQVILNGKAISEYKAKELAKKLAVVHQQNIAPSDMTVEKLTSYGRIPHKNLFSSTTADDEQAIEWALSCTNLVEKRKMMLDALSGGEKQRVWIAMALAQSTPFLFLDEPTTFLDIYYQYEILELIKSLNKQHALSVVMVLHDINQAIRYSDSIIAMKNGEIIVKGAPKDVITAQTVKEIYGVDVMVKSEETTGLYIVPVRLS